MGIDENAVRVRFIPYTRAEKKKLMKLGVSRNPHDGGDTSWENDEKRMEWQRTRTKKKEYVVDTIKKM